MQRHYDGMVSSPQIPGRCQGGGCGSVMVQASEFGAGVGRGRDRDNGRMACVGDAFSEDAATDGEQEQFCVGKGR